MRASKRSFCSSLADLEPELEQPDAAVDDEILDCGTELEKAAVLGLAAESHDVFDAGPVVPAPIEDHDLAGGGKMRHVALEKHLRFFAVRRRRQGHDAKYARAHPLGDRLDGAALSGRISSLEDDDDALSGLPNPVLELAKPDLKLAQFALIILALELRARLRLLARLARSLICPVHLVHDCIPVSDRRSPVSFAPSKRVSAGSGHDAEPAIDVGHRSRQPPREGRCQKGGREADIVDVNQLADRCALDRFRKQNVEILQARGRPGLQGARRDGMDADCFSPSSKAR